MVEFTCPRCQMTSHNPHDAEAGYCGNCHDWTALTGVFRLYVDGVLVDSDSVMMESPNAQLHVEAIERRQARISERADERGEPWLCEIQLGRNLPVRFGTDRARMPHGRPVEVIHLPDFPL